MLTTITASRTALDDIAPTLALRAYLAGLGVAAALIVSATILASLGAQSLFG